MGLVMRRSPQAFGYGVGCCTRRPADPKPMKIPTSHRVARGLLAVLALSAPWALVQTAAAGPVAHRVKASGQVRVCIWPDYYGITLRSPRDGQVRGMDIDLSAEFARSLGAKLQYVDSSFLR